MEKSKPCGIILEQVLLLGLDDSLVPLSLSKSLS